ncbi:MAG: hypothetical protein KDB05_27810 [Planctomycetales bacterium]|nr:hypothetical protein [Planctomycetales bacterium]
MATGIKRFPSPPVKGCSRPRKTMVTIANADHNNWVTEEYLQRLDEFIKRVSPAG